MTGCALFPFHWKLLTRQSRGETRQKANANSTLSYKRLTHDLSGNMIWYIFIKREGKKNAERPKNKKLRGHGRKSESLFFHFFPARPAECITRTGEQWRENVEISLQVAFLRASLLNLKMLRTKAFVQLQIFYCHLFYLFKWRARFSFYYLYYKETFS